MPTNPSESNRKESTHKVLNQLIQLQELVIARAHQEASMAGTRLTQLEASIASMTAGLPTEVSGQFRRLYKKSPLAVVPVVKGVCSACGMLLPVSLVHEVHLSERMFSCPSCARILYHAEMLPRSLRRSQRRGEAPKVGIERFSSESLMIPRLSSPDPESVLAELCGKLEMEGFVDSAGRLLEEALKREAIISTSVDCGLAFPHVRGVEGGGLTLTVGLHSKGIKFGSDSRTLTRIFFFLVIPTAASAFYLKLLSGLSQVFQKEEAREKLLEADTPSHLWKALIKLTKGKIQ